MTDAYFDLTAEQIAARLQACASAAAGEPVAVGVGDEAHGVRNIGVELPKRRRPAKETVLLRRRIGLALEAVHVRLAPSTLAPKVPGALQGEVQVRTSPGRSSAGEAAHLLVVRPSPDPVDEPLDVRGVARRLT